MLASLVDLMVLRYNRYVTIDEAVFLCERPMREGKFYCDKFGRKEGFGLKVFP